MPRSPLLEMDDDPLSGPTRATAGRAKPPLNNDSYDNGDDKAIQQEKSMQQEPWERDVFASHPPPSIATSKPLPIVVRGIVEQHDPEATPTALNAFPQRNVALPDTHTSMTDDDDDVDTYAHAGVVVQDGQSGRKDDGNTAAQSADLQMVGNEPVASTSTPTKARKKSTSISVLRTRVCKAASKGDLDALLAILHPSPRFRGASGDASFETSTVDNGDDDDADDYPSSFALVNSTTATGLTPLLEAASKGHLHVVRHLVEEEGAVRDLEDLEGENAFLKASYRGHLHVMKYLAGSSGGGSGVDGADLGHEEGGTSVNAADREGWTALHNACTKGFLEVVMWLSENGADIDAQSVQGYTPLMNAASKGHLPIVNYLLTRHAPDLFLRNAYQETAYDVAVATYELGIADILASHEAKLWASTSSSAGSQAKPYNPLGMHVTVPVIVYENQRLDLRWFSRAKRSLSSGAGSVSSPVTAVGGAQHPDIKFTSSALSRRDGHASSELPPSYQGLNGSGKWIPVRRSEIGLPCVAEPRALCLPAAATSGKRAVPQRNSEADQENRPQASSSSSSSSSIHPQQQQQAASSSSTNTNEAAWLWLSETFFVDLSPATIDPDQGWQYASSFDEPEENWSAQMPLEVVRILGGGGEVPSSGKNKWVRRRRWARIMRRRLDLPHWGFDDDLESTTHEVQDADSLLDGGKGRQLEQLKPMQDYLERAQYFAGSSRILKQSRFAGDSSSQDGQRSDDGTADDDDASVRSLRTIVGGPSSNGATDHAAGRKVVARLDRALRELREGTQDDTDEVRKLQAETLVGIFQERLEELKREHPQADLDAEDAESFNYPGADDESDLDDAASISTSLRSASVYSPATRSPAGPRRSISSISGSPAARQHAPPRPDVSRQLSSNPDFRIPTHEMPRLANVPHLHARPQAGTRDGSSSSSRGARSSTPWEPDESTSECRRCQRKFTFFLRKHHCRKCGLVVCAHCSSHNDYLRSHQVVHEPWTSTNDLDPIYLIQQLEGGGFYRTCDVCHQALRTEAATIDPDLLLGPLPRLQTASSPESTAALSLAPSIGDAHEAGSPMQRSISDMSELGECPVCGTDLEQFTDKVAQEQHVQTCLESGTPSRLQDNRYLVFTLPDTSPLVDTDCLICFESYEAGDHIGRLSCLCHFHKHCIANWLSRGKSCPVHAP